MLLCGIDIGTSACKAAVFDEQGKLIAEESARYPLYYPKPDWAEQNPQDWWKAAVSCIRSVVRKSAHYGQIGAVGVSGQSWSLVPIDRAGRVLANTPIWTDTRAGEICERLKATETGARLEKTGGNPLGPGYSTGKLIWLKENMPEVYEKTDKFLNSNAYIAYQLTGETGCDLSQGYGLHFYDVKKGAYDASLAAECGIDINKLPPLIESHEILGLVNLRAATETGLLPGIPVVAGGLDAACATLGAGVTQPGMTQEQGGQAGGMSICVDKPFVHKSLILGDHVIPGLWLLQGGTAAGGAALRWASQLFDENDFDRLDSEAAAAPPGCARQGGAGLIFLPYLSGERSPIWDKDARGLFLGLDITHGRGHILRAVMEGVAFSLRHNLETAAQTGAVARTLISTGGASRSRVWMKIKADITGLPITAAGTANTSALGAAMLAGIGAELFKNAREATESMVKNGVTVEPDPALKSLYDRLYGIYIDAYTQNAELMKRLRMV